MSNIGYSLWMRENKAKINEAKQPGEHIFVPARRLWKELSEEERHVGSWSLWLGVEDKGSIKWRK